MEETPAPPRTSVIVVSYNCAAALRRCLAALEASAGRGEFEVLAVDNGSFDDSADVPADFPQVIPLRLPRNFGFTKALNIGMRTAKGEFYFYLSPYVEVAPETVSSLASRLAAADEAVGVCPLLASPDGAPIPELFSLPGPDAVGGVARAGAFLPAPAPDLTAERVAVSLPSLSAFLVRSYFLKGLRYIDERYAQSWADAEIAAQIRRAGRKIYLYPDLHVAFRPEEDPLRFAPPAVRALLASDWASGASVYASKNFGFPAGLKVRLGVILYALVSVFGFRDASFRFSRLVKLLSAAKVDGTQAAL